MATIREKLNERANELDDESLRTRLSEIFDEPGLEGFITTPFEILGGKTPEEVVQAGTDEERQELEVIITYAETPPWYADTTEA